MVNTNCCLVVAKLSSFVVDIEVAVRGRWKREERRKRGGVRKALVKREEEEKNREKARKK